MMFSKELKKPNYFITLLEKGERIGQTGISRAEFLKWSEDLGYDVRNANKHFDECFDTLSGMDSNGVLKMEYYSRLIEWRELQEARKASQQANRTSWIAIILSIIAIFITCMFALKQISTPVKLRPDTVKEIVANKNDLQHRPS